MSSLEKHKQVLEEIQELSAEMKKVNEDVAAGNATDENFIKMITLLKRCEELEKALGTTDPGARHCH